MTPSIVLISSSSDEDNDDDDQSNSDEEEEEPESENDSVYSESDDPDYNNDDVENSDEEECFHDSDDNEVCHRQGSNDSLELSLDECKEYLRKHQLRLSGTKEECIQRIKEHGRLKDGRGELLYPRSSFSINCTGDACKGDVVLFRQTTHKKQGNIAGERTVAGRIVNESYGPSKQQHTFTVLVAAFLNRSHVSNSNPQMFHGNENEHWNNIPMTNETLSLSHTDRFRFLDKACIRKQEGNSSNAKESPWRLCTVNQVEVLWSKPLKSLPPLSNLLVKGRNLYGFGTYRQAWKNEAERLKVLGEKHTRGDAARHTRKRRQTEFASNIDKWDAARRTQKRRQREFASNNDKGAKRQKLSNGEPSQAKHPTRIDKHKSAKRLGAAPVTKNATAHNKAQNMKYKTLTQPKFHGASSSSSSSFPYDRTSLSNLPSVGFSSYGVYNNGQPRHSNVLSQPPPYHHYNYRQPGPRHRFG